MRMKPAFVTTWSFVSPYDALAAVVGEDRRRDDEQRRQGQNEGGGQAAEHGRAV